MIAYLKGHILKKLEKTIIINTGNIGYLVNTTQQIILNSTDEIELFIYSHIKEDQYSLYGFIEYEDLEFFQKLISINGIGPKAGLEILNSGRDKMKQAIIKSDEKTICSIKGIGAKTAKRLILELKDKITFIGTHTQEFQPTTLISNTIKEETIDALTTLGYKQKNIEKTLNRFKKEFTSSEEAIHYFLKNN